MSDVSLTGEKMDTDMITMPDSEDLASIEAHVDVPSVTESKELVTKEEVFVAMPTVTDSGDLVSIEKDHPVMLTVADSEDSARKEGHVGIPVFTNSEDLVCKKEGRMVMPSVTVNEGSNEQGDESYGEPVVEVNEGVNLGAEITEGNHGDGVAEITEGNHGDGVAEIDVSGEKTVESSLATEKTFGEDVVVEADIETCSEPKAESGNVAEKETAEDADAVNKESLDHTVIENSFETSLRPCSISAKQLSSDLSGEKLADVSDSPGLVEASTVIGDVSTQEMSSLCELNIQKGNDVTADHEMNKETVVKGNKQDELSALAGGNRSIGCDEPLATAPHTEISVKETQQLVQRSDSSLISDVANYSVIHGESQHPKNPQVSSISIKDDSFSFDLPITVEGDVKIVSQPFGTSQDLAISGAVAGSAIALISTPNNRKRSQTNSQGPKESPEPKKRRSTARKGGKKGSQPDDLNLLKQLDGEERPTNIFATIGSNLPTIDFSSSQPAAFQHQNPFTDLQQLQLRAQIFVYGSLIQGNAPDEACLITSFGGHDGGRSIWEKPWRKWLDMIHNQIPQTNMKNTELQNSGKSTPDQTMKRKGNTPPRGSAGKSDSKTVNPVIPLSSPFWSMHTSAPQGLQVSDISQAPLVDNNLLPPKYPFQSPAKSTGHVTPWSTNALHPFTQSSSWDSNMSLFSFPNSEPVKLIPVKESYLIPYSSANHSSADLPRSNIAASALSSEIVGEVKVVKPQGQIAKESKGKKPKRVSVSNNASQILEPAFRSSKVALANADNDIQPAPVKAYSFPAANSLTSSAAPCFSSDHISVEDKDAGKKDMVSGYTLHQINKAKLHAEEAAACAEAAVSYCRDVWDQLDKQKNSELAADHESKVTSAAVAITAAVSIAKAAAAAAKLASEAALQAKLMAEDSLASIECIKDGSVIGAPLSDGLNHLDDITLASILKGETSANISTSIICAAKEAARRKIESAMYESKHAQNLDAIVKAAELAAEAVAQTGRVVAMGDPLPLSELMHSGPEGYWKLYQQPPGQLAISNSKEVSLIKEANGGIFSSKMVQDGNLNLQPSQHTVSENQSAPEIATFEIIEAQTTTSDLFSTYVANEDMDANAVVPSELVCKKDSPLSFQQEYGNIVDTSIDNHIKEGSVVEVFKEWGSVKAAWFAAKVLDLKDDKVCVSYIEKQTRDGEYKEWITLSCVDNTAPIVRIAQHSMTVVSLDGAMKRRRSAIGRRCWGVGDKVDAWMQDCWWEGLIVEKNNKDELSLTVQFPAQGETCVVKAWNLRPSLIWKDGAWVQWSDPNISIGSRQEDDTPRGKRQRLNRAQTDDKGKAKASESHDQPSLTGLSDHDKKFNIGKNTKKDGMVNAQRMIRTGLREGSKVIFGVPKPGKKRKFMDVGNSNEHQKTSRVPISQGPHGWKNNSSRTAVHQKTSKSKAKDASVTPSEDDEGREVNHTTDNDNGSGTEQQAETESCSVDDEATDDSILISSLARPPTDPSSKSSALVIMKSKRAIKGNLGLGHVKKVDVVEDKVFHETTQQDSLDAGKTRRSNRRIQPTSRLLEGLQTSVSIAKVASTGNRK